MRRPDQMIPETLGMWFSRSARQSIPKEHPDKALYAHLAQLNGAYMMQDYDIWADTLPEVLDVYVEREGREAALQLRLDISRLLAAKCSLDDAEFARQYETIFCHGESMEGFEGRTTRQWLELFCDRLAKTLSPS